MELISTIINELTNINISLTSPLLKTKVLAKRLQNQQLLEWVNNELTGYKISEVIPAYRKTNGEICGNWQNGNWHATNRVINFPEFNEETTQSLYEIQLTQSIQALESLNADGRNYIAETIDTGQKRVLESYLKSQNPYFNLLEIYRRTPSTFIHDVLSNIRDSLLNFMLQIEESYDYVSEIKELKQHNNEITKIMNTTINNSGDGNILNTGSNNEITNIVTIKKGDKNALKEHLLRNKLDIDSIEDLLKIVDLEKPKSNDNFGNQVTLWIGKMINKAVDGSWQIGISAAGGIIATALQQYYGI
ncbi:hypothetical protein HDE69_004291 [Pedobacter cryoconitis]|uniref:AbiTii domain-containing protein n=1 Tax=Pedobacter cryoconitis TaxID=188932 RepID=A0A7W8YWR5_9SPHI|nr:hypothetical protein [Pedobacter cryoconitis]MBB5623208.1 hypothetical protein [Pedobacter cryoconitis]